MSRTHLSKMSLSIFARYISKPILPSSLRFVVQTAFGIPGKSELTDSSTSRPWRNIRNELRAPRPHAVKICGVSEFGRIFITFASSIGSRDSSSSASARLSSPRGRKYACGRGRVGSDMPKAGYDVELNSGSLSSSPSFWN